MSHPPGRDGWHMPAEWHPHEATWIAWPHHAGDWPGKFHPIPWVYADIVRHLHTGEKVHILVNDAEAEKRARQILERVHVDFGQVRFFRIATDRVWTRDYGPIFLTNREGEVGFTSWRFNGWAKYANCKKDAVVADRLARRLRLPNWKPAVNGRRVVLEGGSIDVNGQGLLLSTEECLLSPVRERNPALTRADLEGVFADFLGIRKVIWLGRGIAGDDTHGHVDDLARFVGPRTVVAVTENSPADANYEPLADNLRRLREMTDQEGKPLEVVTLPMPEPRHFDGQRLPASYANFYIANEKVLVPTFNDPRDRVALDTLADLFLDREVVGIHALDLVWGLGTLHCLTQQQPAGGPARSDLPRPR